MPEEPYKVFDKDPIVDTSDVVIKGFSFRIRELILGGAVIVLIIILIILASLLGAANNKLDNGASTGAQVGCVVDQCFTPACFQTAAHVTQLMNATQNPCTDFHTYVCGNFPKVHPLLPYEDEVDPNILIHNQNWDRLRVLLEQINQDTNTNSFEYKLRTFFETCNDHYHKSQAQGKPFLDKMVTPSGGWWVLEGDTAWNSHPYNFHKQLKSVHVDFWVDAFFTFSVTTDWNDWNQKAILIDFSGIALPAIYYTYPDTFGRELKTYKDFIRTVAGLLVRDAGLALSDSEKTTRIETFVEDAVYVESNLAQFYLSEQSTADPFNDTSRLSLSAINVHALGAVDFVDFFRYMFSDAGVTANTKVIVVEQAYFNRSMAFIDSLPANNKSRILNNYLIWRLANSYAQDLSWDYIHANREHYVEQTGNRIFLGTWRYCMGRLDRNFNEALSALFVRNHFSDENRQSATEIVNYVKRSMIESLRNSLHWMSPDTRDTAIKKLEESIYKLGYPDYMMSDLVLNQLYSIVEIKPDDYFGNLINLNKYFRYDWNKQLSRHIDTTRQEVWVYNTYDMVAEYYNPWRELIVPAGLLQFPIYDHTSPRYMNFGSLGSIVARQLIHAIDQIGSSYKLDGSHFGNWWSNATVKAYQEIKNCTVDAYKNLNNGPYLLPGDRNPSFKPVPAENYAPIALGEASGVRLAFKAYRDWIGEAGEEKQFPGGLYTNNQMFFINYAQSSCFNRNPLAGWDRASRGSWVQENVRINAALAQVKDFQDAFQCKAGDPMVAPKHCNLY